MWIVFALLSAVFAALTSIFAKIGIDGVNSNLATAVRTVVVVVMSWLMVFITNNQSGLAQISKKSWVFLILSGIATGASWLCYYRALQLGKATEVAAVEHYFHFGFSVYFFARYIYGEITHRLCAHCNRDNFDGVVDRNSVRNFPYACFTNEQHCRRSLR